MTSIRVLRLLAVVANAILLVLCLLQIAVFIATPDWNIHSVPLSVGESMLLVLGAFVLGTLNLAALFFGDWSDISRLKREVKKAELMKKLRELGTDTRL